MCRHLNPPRGTPEDHTGGAPPPPSVVMPPTPPGTSEQDHCITHTEEHLPKDATSVPLRLHGYEMNDCDAGPKEDAATKSDNPPSTDVARLLSRSENLCVRHQRMADEGANARLQKVRLLCAQSVPAQHVRLRLLLVSHAVSWCKATRCCADAQHFGTTCKINPGGLRHMSFLMDMLL